MNVNLVISQIIKEEILNMQTIKNWDFPKIAMVSIEFLSYLYLCFGSTQKTSFRISLYLAIVAAVNIALIVCAIMPKIYYYYTKLFIIVVVLTLLMRVLAIIFLFKLSNEPSEEFYLTSQGFDCLFQTSLIFLALNCILIYEKNHYYKTQKSEEQRLLPP